MCVLELSTPLNKKAPTFMSPSSKGDKGSTKKGSTRVSGYSGKVRIPRPAEEPKWQVDADFKPPRKISDKELEAARKMFFELDRDGSGSIDAEELGLMLRSLGQNPSDEELHALIDSVDTGDKDGQIQLREFLLLYTQGLDTKTKGAANTEDINNIFNALGGNPSNAEDAVERAHLVDVILENYDLDVDIAFTFGKNVGSDGKLTKADIETMMVTKEAAA